MSTEELDSQLVSTLREIDPHNYVYLFERCKTFNVDARHLRFFKKDQIRELIPKSELGILAEFEYLLNLWQISKGYTSLNTKIQSQAQSNLITIKEEPHIVSNNQPVVVAKQAIDIKPSPTNLQRHQISSLATVVDEPEVLLTELHSDENSKISNAKGMKFEEDDEEEFTLETIIPELLKELKDSYESKNSLSTNERRFLCRAIVDYFVSRKIKFSSDTMDELAEQIVEHFPTEDKKSWCNRDGRRTHGRLTFRLRNSRRSMANQTSTNSNSSEDEDDEEELTLETIIPELLKELKDSYESKNSLSTNERRFLCRAIVDYFVSRKIKFSSDTMDELAEQIVEHFPTEDKISWCNGDGYGVYGRLVSHLRYSRKKIAKQTINTSTSKVVTYPTSSEDENSKIYNAMQIKFEENDEDKFDSNSSVSRKAGNKCSLPHCRRSKRSSNVKLFRFPHTDSPLFKKWAEKCNFDEQFIANSSLLFLCDKHFSLELIGKKFLKRGAVPSLYLTENNEDMSVEGIEVYSENDLQLSRSPPQTRRGSKSPSPLCTNCKKKCKN